MSAQLASWDGLEKSFKKSLTLALMGICEKQRGQTVLESGNVFDTCAVQHILLFKSLGSIHFFFLKKLEINSQQTWVDY